MTERFQRYALWLLPGGDQAHAFSAAIATLAQHYQAPGFAPHVTLACGINASKLLAIGEQLAATNAQIRAQPCGLGYGQAFFRHLYVDLAPCHSLTHLQQQAAEQSGDLRSFQPHLSLLYRDAALRDEVGYRRTLENLKLSPFRLDTLALIALAEKPSAWRELSRHRLQR